MDTEHLSQEKSVIEKAYEVTTNPEILDEFEAYWEAYLDRLLQNKSKSDIDLENAPINAHILRAIEIIDRMGVLKSVQSYAQNIVDSNYGIGFIIDKDGQILSRNSDAESFTHNVDHFRDLDFDKRGLDAILNWIRRDVDPQKRQVLFEDVVHPNEETTCLFVTPLKLISDENVRPHYHFLVTSVDYEFDLETLTSIKDKFELTTAEIEIVGELVNGKNNSEISKSRKVSKTTVDKQVKQIRSKTQTRSVVDLVRLIGGMSTKMSSVTRQVSRAEELRIQKHGMVRRNFINLRDGRRYEYIEQGHPNGIPVLNIHSLLSSGRLTPSAEVKCVHRGWRFISPSRHGYGGSDRSQFSTVMDMIDTSIDDFCMLLDHLNIEKVYVIDAKYGQRFAARHPDRTNGLIFVNSTPQWHADFLDLLPGRRRNMVKTSIHAPAAVRYLARVGHLLIQSGRERVFLTGLSKDDPMDLKALKNPEIYEVLRLGVRHVVAQGVEAHALDVRVMHTDLSDDARLLKCPVSLLYGEHCKTLQPVMAERYLELWPATKISKIKGAGTFLFHTHFDEVLQELESQKREVSRR